MRVLQIHRFGTIGETEVYTYPLPKFIAETRPVPSWPLKYGDPIQETKQMYTKTYRRMLFVVHDKDTWVYVSNGREGAPQNRISDKEAERILRIHFRHTVTGGFTGG